MATHLLLLRGINVGGRNRLPMADLRALVAGARRRGVATYLQSGNAVCRAPVRPAHWRPAWPSRRRGSWA